MELNSNTIDAVLINGRQARPDNLIPYQTFDVTNVKNFRFQYSITGCKLVNALTVIY